MCKRGDIYWADIPQQKGSQNQAGYRPVLIVANDKATQFSPTFQCAPLTTQIKKEYLPTHVILTSGNLFKKTMALVEQTTSIDRSMLRDKIGELSSFDMMKINKAILVQFAVETCNVVEEYKVQQAV